MLIGREAELRVVDAFIVRAMDGAGGALVVTGDPGVGKSTFLAEVERRYPGLCPLRARGVASETAIPFSGLQQLTYGIRHLIDRLPELQADALRGATGLARREADRYLVSLATLGMLSEVAAAAPVLLVVDDVPWIDAASRDAILFACRRLRTERAVALLASRSEDWATIGDAGLEVLELAAFTSDEVARLVAARGPAAPSEDVARRVAGMTAGNPLAVIEFMAELTEEQLTGRAPLPARLPLTRGLERTFAARLADLPGPLREAMLVLAADDTGRREVIERTTMALGLEGTVLDRLLERGLAVERAGEGVDVRHPLIRSAAYARAGLDERRRVHAALADALKVDEPNRAVWHRAAATEGRDDEVATALAAAAVQARSRGALAEAMAAWERAAELAVEHSTRTEALLAAAAAGWGAGQLERAMRGLDGLDRAGPSQAQQIEAMWIRGGIELASGDALRAHRTLVAAADRCRATDPVRALLMLNLAAEAASLANDRLATADLGRHAPPLRSDASVAERLLHAALLGFAADFAGDVASAVGHLRRAVALAADVDDPTSQLIAGRAAIYAGDDAAARALHLAVIEEARERGSVDLIPLAAPRLATAELLLGRWRSAAATAAESSRIADETGQLLLAPHGRATLAILAAMQGDEAAMLRHLEDAMAAVGDRPIGLIEDDGHWARGILSLGKGDHRAALAHLERITHPVVQLLSALDRVEAAAAASDVRLSEWIAPVAPLADDDGPAWAVARYAYGMGLVADDGDAAAASYRRALAAAAESTRPFERARIQLGVGTHLRRRRRRVEARDHLRAAAATFELLGAIPWAERAHAELRATGESAARRDVASVDRLTPQELQVARAVAEGHANKEVAARLFLSPRTVEFHLRNVFAKLEITSRSQLARIPLDDPATGA